MFTIGPLLLCIEVEWRIAVMFAETERELLAVQLSVVE